VTERIAPVHSHRNPTVLITVRRRSAHGRSSGRPHLIIPYTLDTNDFKFVQNGFSHGEEFFAYCRDAFDVLYEEGKDAPKMMSIGLHCRLVGRPGRAKALARLVDHIQRHDRVWLCRRVEIARHWRQVHPWQGG
jgi:peptidoglycan/xylan/chitin deacetylase (PgdA/CDA1 family)